MNGNAVKQTGSTRLRRQLSFLDLLFLSFGGQAALISFFTYASAVVIKAGPLAPLAILVGTIIVLFNAASVYGLSKRYGEAGGYYIYAFYALTRKLSFETGWAYLFYSVLYGAAYVFGGTYLLHTYLHMPSILAASILLIPSIMFLVSGIRPSAKYAMVVSSVELAILVAIVVINLIHAHFRLISLMPRVSAPPGAFAAAIIFAVGIPTGYGSITPLGGEAIRKEDVGRAALTVVVIGGVLEAAAIYSVIDAAYVNNISLSVSTGSPLLKYLLHYYGVLAFIFLAFAAFNDGILALLSYMSATSRTVYAMGKNSMLPRQLALVRGGHPLNAVIVTSAMYALVSLVPLALLDHPFQLFLVYGAAAGMANLFVHISANVSYTLEGIRGFRRALRFSSLRRYRWYVTKAGDVAIGLVSTTMSFYFLVSSTTSSGLEHIFLTFLAWLLTGFIWAEVLEELHVRESHGASSEA